MKLVTYNMRYSLGRDERFDLPRIAHAIQGADIVALQEVERFWPRSGMVDQPAALGALLPEYYWVYGPAFDVDGSVGKSDGTVLNRRRQFGNMLMSKSPIVSSRLYVLPKIATVDRFNMDMGAIEGVVETGAGPVRVYSLHLSHLTSRERTAQINTLLDIHRRALLGGGAWCGNGTSSGRDWTAGEPMPPMPSDAILMSSRWRRSSGASTRGSPPAPVRRKRSPGRRRRARTRKSAWITVSSAPRWRSACAARGPILKLRGPTTTRIGSRSTCSRRAARLPARRPHAIAA